MQHILKIQPEYFQAVLDRKKTFEIRLNDRDYKVGDSIILKEFDYNYGFTGRNLRKTISYISDYAQKENMIVMSIE